MKMLINIASIYFLMEKTTFISLEVGNISAMSRLISVTSRKAMPQRLASITLDPQAKVVLVHHKMKGTGESGEMFNAQ